MTELEKGSLLIDGPQEPAVAGFPDGTLTGERKTWQAKLGFLVPSGNTVFEHDARIALPDSVSFHVARLPLTRDEPEEVAALHEGAPAASELLRHAGVDAIVFACTGASLYHGRGFDQEIAARIGAVAGAPGLTTASAVADALDSLGLRRVVMVSPYEQWQDDLTVAFLKSCGVTVTATLGPALPEAHDMEAATPGEIADYVNSDVLQDADGVFISCTAFRGMEAAAQIRRKYGVPVVSSNEATFWATLRMIGLAGDIFPRNGFEDLRS
ncbi:aspartate/glutamate racemase family protein [Arthrobacter globiformis]|uniref:maleate cis-trans isomerase family protein n=1 Tax=Arthrobacter globiformis TaxID=1665 RepID=UPI00397DAE6C